MRWIEQLIFQLMPSVRVRPRWRTVWEQRERRAFRTNAYYFFGFFTVAYLAHFFFIDLPLHKEPIILWAKYRFGLAVLGMLGLILTRFRYRKARHFKLPVALIGWAFAFMQAQSMIWRKEVPYGYSVVIPCIVAVALRTSVANSLIFLLVCFASEYSAWRSRPEEVPYVFSAAIVAAIFVALFRSRMTSDVDAFIAEQERSEAQQDVIDAHRETAEQIRAFLPKEIYRRVENLMQSEKKTIVQAMDEVLRPRQVLVTVLHSDIRRFTQMTKAVNGFAVKAAIPSMKTCTEIVERLHGIPRPVGDLIFAYFESENPGKSFHEAIRAAAELTLKNEALNNGLDPEQRVRRYVLLSFGSAIVGNMGGTESAREITAFGNPANILNRLDTVIKAEAIQQHLGEQAIVFTYSAHLLAERLFPSLTWKNISLQELDVVVRDFPEETSLHLLPLGDQNIRALEQVPPNGYNINYSEFVLQVDFERLVV